MLLETTEKEGSSTRVQLHHRVQDAAARHAIEATKLRVLRREEEREESRRCEAVKGEMKVGLSTVLKGRGGGGGGR